MDAVVDAARKANIHSFIAALPQVMFNQLYVDIKFMILT